jgi:hypothetical protein
MTRTQILKQEMEDRIERVWRRGPHNVSSKARFLDYLLEVGLAKYEKVIEPLETEYEAPQEPVKIIQFPGGKAE